MCCLRNCVFGLILSVVSVLGVEYRQAPEEFYSPQLRLYFYACEGSVEGIDASLKEGAEIDQLSGEDFNALHYAIVLNRKEVVEYLIASGANVDARVGVERSRNDAGRTALALAAIRGYTDIGMLLLNAGADPEASREYEGHNWKTNAVSCAIEYNRNALVDAFVANGIDVSRPISVRSTDKVTVPILAIASKHGSIDQVKRLVEQFKVPVTYNYSIIELSPLHDSVRYGNYDVAKYLIGKGADVNQALDWSQSRPGKWTCLALAAFRGSDKITRLLLENGARPVQSKKDYNDPVFLADALGYEAILELYESYGFKSNYWGHLAARDESSQRRVESIPVESLFTSKQLGGDWAGWGESEPKYDSEGVRLAVISDEASRDIGAVLQAEWSTRDRVEVYERDQIEGLIREHSLDRSGLLNGDGLAELSQITGANTLILIRELNTDSKDAVHEIRLIDARRGILLDMRLISGKSKGLEAFCRNHVVNSLQRLSKFNADKVDLLALAVVNVRADYGSLSAIQLERQAHRLLEYELSKQPNVLVMQRQDLDKLRLENQLSGLSEMNFASSAGFVDARLVLNEEKDGIVAIHLRLDIPGQVAKELRVEAMGQTLSDSLREALPQLMNDGMGGEQLTGANDLREDVNRLVAEAKWLRNVGLHAESLDYVRNAISLEQSKLGIWKLYLNCLSSTYPDLPEHHEFANSKNFERVFLHEQERLYVMDSIYRLLAEKGGGQLYELSDAHEDFEYTITLLDAVSLHRRYGQRIRLLEEDYLSLVERRVVPIYSFYRNAEKLAYPNYSSEFDAVLRVFRSLREVDKGRVEACAKQIIRAFSAQYEDPKFWSSASITHFRFNDYPHRANQMGWMRDKQVMQWVVEYASPYVAYDFLTDAFNSYHGSWFKKKYTSIKDVTQWNKLRTGLHSRMSMRHKFFANIYVSIEDNSYTSMLGNDCMEHEPLVIGLGQGVEWSSMDRVAIGCLRRVLYPKSRDKELSGIELDPVQLRHIQSLFQGAVKVFPWSEDQASVASAKLEMHLAAPDMNSTLDEGRKHKNGILPVSIWHPEAYGFSGFEMMHDPVLHKGHWYLLATNGGWRQHETRDYVLFKIDAETFETTGRKFKSPHIPRYNYDSSVAIDDNWLIFSGDKERPITCLKLKDLSTHVINGYRGKLHNMPDGCMFKGKFYTVATPAEDVERYKVTELSRLLIEYDPESRELNVLANSRRKPASVAMDAHIAKVYRLVHDHNIDSLVMVRAGRRNGKVYKIDTKNLDVHPINYNINGNTYLDAKAIERYREMGIITSSGWSWFKSHSHVPKEWGRWASSSALIMGYREKIPYKHKAIEWSPVYTGKECPAYDVLSSKLKKNEVANINRFWHDENVGGFIASNDGVIAFFKTEDLAAALKESTLLPKR
jgi:ankyrin repeat protein